MCLTVRPVPVQIRATLLPHPGDRMHTALLTLFLGNLALAGGPKFDAASQNLVGTYATVDGSYRVVLDRFSQPRAHEAGRREGRRAADPDRAQWA